LKLDPQLFGGGGEIGQSDPKSSLDALRSVKGEVKRVGSEKVRGTHTTRYRVTIDPEQAVESAPEERRDAVRSSVTALGSVTIPADVWVDGKGRLRKMLRITASGSTAKGSVAFEHFDLGAGVSVKEPPASEAVDFLDVLGGGSPTTEGSG
jgi:hypothetical protein